MMARILDDVGEFKPPECDFVLGMHFYPRHISQLTEPMRASNSGDYETLDAQMLDAIGASVGPNL